MMGTGYQTGAKAKTMANTGKSSLCSSRDRAMLAPACVHRMNTEGALVKPAAGNPVQQLNTVGSPEFSR